MTDHYAVLGVPDTAAPQQIADAYHRLVRRHHPDAGNERPDVLQAVLDAYAVLRDPASRAEYDRRRARPARRPLDEPAIRAGPVRYHGPPGS